MSPLDFIRSHADIFARCGSVVASYRSKNGRRCGPYYRLAYRSGGRQLSLYLGASEELSTQVRTLLTELQARRDYYRMVAQSERRRRENLLRIKRQWQQAALARGLYARGWELRGWRPPSLPRLSLPRVSLTLPLPSVPYRFYTSILRPLAAPIVIEPPSLPPFQPTKPRQASLPAPKGQPHISPGHRPRDPWHQTAFALKGPDNWPPSPSPIRSADTRLRPRIWQNRPSVDQRPTARLTGEKDPSPFRRTATNASRPPPTAR